MGVAPQPVVGVVPVPESLVVLVGAVVVVVSAHESVVCVGVVVVSAPQPDPVRVVGGVAPPQPVCVGVVVVVGEVDVVVGGVDVVVGGVASDGCDVVTGLPGVVVVQPLWLPPADGVEVDVDDVPLDGVLVPVAPGLLELGPLEPGLLEPAPLLG